MDCPNCNTPILNTNERCSCGFDLSGNQVPATVSENAYEGPLYLFISVKRLVFMSILSFSLYEIYWMYKNWSFIKKRELLKISPFWRSILGVFFCHELLKKIYGDSELNKIAQPGFSHSGLATGWVIFTVLGGMANRATDRIDDAQIGFIVWVLSLLTFIFFIPVQKYINHVHESIGCQEKYNLWSKGHTIFLVLGILGWFLMLCSLA